MIIGTSMDQEICLILTGFTQFTQLEEKPPTRKQLTSEKRRMGNSGSK